MAATVLLALLVVVATLTGRSSSAPPTDKAGENRPASKGKGSSSHELSAPLLPTSATSSASCPCVSTATPVSFPMQVLQCWNLPHNFSRMVAVNSERGGDTAALNGVRALSMMFIVLGHTWFWSFMSGFVNPGDVLPPHGALGQYSFQSIPSAEFCVDSFFLLSAFLVTLALLKRFATGKSFNYGVYVLHRYLRITPSYLFVMAVFTSIVPRLSSGPFWYLTSGKLCNEFMWTNVLYLGNLIPWHMTLERSCMSWSWYLNNDFQFFCLTPLFVWLYNKKPVAGVAVVLSLLTASVVALCIHSYHSLVFSVYDLGNDGFGNNSDIYTRPWYRIQPYFVGMLGAMAWHKYRPKLVAFFQDGHKGRTSTTVRWVVFLVTVLLLATIWLSARSFYHGDSKWSRARLAVFTAFTRPAWAALLMVLCILWFAYPGAVLARFMAAGVWEPFARLTFGTYLLHPVVLSLVFFSNPLLHRYSPLQLAFDFAGALTLAYASSCALFLLVEKPFMSLEVLLLKKAGVGATGE